MPAARGSASGQTFPCPDCEKTFSRKEVRRVPVTAAYEAMQADRARLPAAQYMARHYRSKHSKEKPFQCEYCEHAFSRRCVQFLLHGKEYGLIAVSRSDLLRRHYKTCAEAKAQRGETSAGASPPTRRSSTASTSAGKASVPAPAAPAEPQRTIYEMPFAANSPAHAAMPAPPSSHFLPTPPPAYYAHMSMPMPMPDHPIYGLPPATNMHSSFSVASGSGSAPSPENGPSPFSNFSNSSNMTLSSNSPQTPFTTDASLPPAPSFPQLGMMPPPPPHPSASSTVPSVPPAVPSTAPHPHSSTATPMTPSTSAFKSGSLSHDTLAPGLSRTGSFTRDEVLASEVLRDLMRSPLGMSGGTPPVSTAAAGGMAWHPTTGNKDQGATAQDRGAVSGAGGAGAVASGDVHDWALSSVFGSTTTTTTSGASNGVLISAPYAGPAVTPHNKLEETPAAQALAEYFNKGGVGGITALDLGFPTEPSLFPDWMFKAPAVHEDEKRFWMPEQKFCLGCTSPLLSAHSDASLTC